MDSLKLRLPVQLFLVLGAVALFAPGVTAARSPVPFKATIAITEQIQQPGDVCPLVGEISGSGRATHLGKLTLVSRDCIIPMDQTFTTFSFASLPQSLILTAANGDQIFGSYSGTLTFEGTIAAITGGYQISGGTGRFSQATGAGSIQGMEDISTTPAKGQLQLNGTILY